MFRRILRWTAIGLIAAVVSVSAAYFLDMNQAYERVLGKSTAMQKHILDHTKEKE